MRNNPWPLALILLFAAFCVLSAWSVDRALRSPGAAVVGDYRTSPGR